MNARLTERMARTRPVLFATFLACLLIAPGVAHAALPLLAVAGGAAVIAGGLMIANDLLCWKFMDCGTGTATMALQHDCYFCGIFVTLACQGGGYSRALYLMFAPMALSLARFCFLLFLAYQVANLFVWPKDGGENLREIVKQGLIFTFVVSTMSASLAGGSNPWLFEWVFDMSQRLALAVSMKAINYMAMQGIGQLVSASVPNFSGGCPGLLGAQSSGAVAAALPYATEVAQQYANLWAHVELGIWPIIVIAMQRLLPDHFTASGAISGILLAAPYIFVMGIFGAFLVQTMFYFIAITSGIPFLLAGTMFQTSRGWLLSAVRFLLGGCATIFFCAIAMGFTLSLVVVNLSISMKSVGADQVGVVQGLGLSPVGIAAKGVMSVFDFLGQAWGSTPAAGTSQAPAATQVVSLELASIDKPAFWQLFLTGYISIMLHLAAPRIASNISGANDSATTAAAVTGIGQMAAARAVGLSSRGVGGAVGSTGTIAGGALGYVTNRAADLIAAFRGAGKP